MRTLKIGILFGILVIGLSACKKIQGPTGEKGDSGPDAIMKSYTLYFNAGDTYKLYSGFVGMMDQGDIIVTYVEDPNEFNFTGSWVQTPFISEAGVNFYSEVTDAGNIFNKTVEAGTLSSPWTGPHYFNYRSVLIKGSGIIKNPNLNLSDFEEVKETFNL